MKLWVLSFALLFLGFRADAQLIESVSEFDGSAAGNGTTIVAQSNLVSTEGTLSSSDYSAFQTASIGVLNDASLGSTANDSASTALTANGSPWTLTIAFNTSVNTAGYTITGLKAFTGWTIDYINQSYSVSYSTVAAPTTFISLGTYTATKTDTTFELATLETSLAPALSQLAIATNVADLQYTFSEGSGDNAHIEAYREIEAFGSASPVPEPSAWSLMLLGGTALGFLAYRRTLLRA